MPVSVPEAGEDIACAFMGWDGVGVVVDAVEEPGGGGGEAVG